MSESNESKEMNTKILEVKIKRLLISKKKELIYESKRKNLRKF